MLTINEKIKIINDSNSFVELNKDVLPKVHKEDYYFVSYSHKDYKKVIIDILLLQEQGINIWYDSDMHIGENWEEIAENYISKFQCKGIIFYLSENSIMSEACNKEVEYVLENNKQYFSINIPLNDDNQTLSGQSMLEHLKRKGHKVSQRKINLFKKAFSDKILYLSINDPLESKIEKIEKLVGEDLFEIDSAGYRRCKIKSCKDNSLIHLELKNNYMINVKDSFSYGETCTLTEIDSCVFTNSFKLKNVKLPMEIKKIGESSFRNCFKLERINLNMPIDYINDHAFSRCSLLDINVINCRFIGRFSFAYCEGLKELVLNAYEFNSFSFAYCENLEKITLKRRVLDFKAYTFNDCKKLRQINYKGKINTIESKKYKLKLQESMFSGCIELPDFSIIGNVEVSGAISMFSGCSKLEKLTIDTSIKNKIPMYMCTRCDSLTDVTGIENFNEIDENAFSYCEKLTDVDLSNIKIIRKQAFAINGHKKIDLSSAEIIETQAFAFNNDLNEVVIGKNLKELGSRVFEGCENIKKISILSGNFYFTYNSFDGLNPEILVTNNYEVLKEFIENNSENLKYIYFKKDLLETNQLKKISRLTFLKIESDVEMFDKYEVCKETSEGLYSTFIGKNVTIVLKNGDWHSVYVDKVGIDKQRNESYVYDGTNYYYESDIDDIFVSYLF